MSSYHEDRLAREDHRNEAASRLRALTRHGELVKRETDERWARRVEPVVQQPNPIEDPEFPGCVW